MATGDERIQASDAVCILRDLFGVQEAPDQVNESALFKPKKRKNKRILAESPSPQTSSKSRSRKGMYSRPVVK